MCKNGTMQSPIDLINERVKVVPGLGRLKRSYKPAHARLRNRGHDIMVYMHETHLLNLSAHLWPCSNGF